MDKHYIIISILLATMFLKLIHSVIRSKGK